MKSFNSKVAVITGAGSGIGRHLSIQMAEQGARVALADVSTKGLEETKLLIEEKGYKDFTFNVDF